MSEVAQNCNRCNAVPELNRSQDDTWWSVRCGNCFVGVIGKTINEAVKAWNREYGWWMTL